MRWSLCIAAALAAAPSAASAQAALSDALAAGQVGERYDGYMGFVTPPSAEVRRQVNAINLRRRNLYIELASRRNVTADLVGMATACELFAELRVGQAYLLNDGVWRRRAPGQAPVLPAHCR